MIALLIRDMRLAMRAGVVLSRAAACRTSWLKQAAMCSESRRVVALSKPMTGLPATSSEVIRLRHSSFP